MNNSPDPSGAIVAGLLLFYGFLILLGLASFVFWIVELIDVARRQFRDQNTKVIWLLVVVFFHGLGSLIYYFVGRPQGWLPGEAPKYPPQTPYGYPPPAPEQWPPAPGFPWQNPPPPENRQE